MSMYRSKKYRKRWRLKWPWRALFPLRLDERFCPECRMPFHDGPLPDEIARFHVDNVVAFVFPGGGWRQNEVCIRVGRWRASGKQFYSSEFIPLADIDNLLAVVEKTKEGIPAVQKTRAQRG
jgi:hypothetical protein